jgi:hypothetical protein
MIIGSKTNAILVAAIAVAFAGTPFQMRSQEAPRKELRLVLLIAVDQFRYDYLTRFRDEYKGGLDRSTAQEWR